MGDRRHGNFPTIREIPFYWGGGSSSLVKNFVIVLSSKSFKIGAFARCKIPPVDVGTSFPVGQTAKVGTVADRRWVQKKQNPRRTTAANVPRRLNKLYFLSRNAKSAFRSVVFAFFCGNPKDMLANLFLNLMTYIVEKCYRSVVGSQKKRLRKLKTRLVNKCKVEKFCTNNDRFCYQNARHSNIRYIFLCFYL